MKLAEILAELDNTGMSIAERSHIRRIIGIPEVDSNTYHLQSEDRFNLISKRQVDGISAEQETKNIYLCKELRTLYKKYDKLGDDTTVIDGGRDGVKFSNNKNRLRFAIQILNRVLPNAELIPNEDIFSEIAELKQTSGKDSGTFQHIPVTYNDYDFGNDEYGS